MKRSRFITLLLAFLLTGQLSSFAQDLTQTIRGSVIDQVTYGPLQAAPGFSFPHNFKQVHIILMYI